MVKRNKLVTTEEATKTKAQHKAPCEDCPFRTKAIPNWLGGHTASDFVAMAHGEEKYMCHVHPNQQCAGMAIYRANVAKVPRDRTILKLPADRKTVFDWPADFMEHHGGYEPRRDEDGC